MISQTITLLQNALNNASYGVNTFLTSKSLPIVSSVVSEIDTYWVCVGGEPKTFPVIIVTLAGEVDFTMPEIRTSIRDIEIPIAITYWNRLITTQEGADLAYRTLECVMNTLRQWTTNDNAPDRITENIQIVEMVNITQSTRAVSQEQDVNVMTSLIITLRVRDTNP
jgi:hypothetical protein